jgi:hypothetical protein
MDTVAEFRRHADECRRTARMTKRPADRAQWELLAERWQRCVEVAESAMAAAANANHERTRQMRTIDRTRLGVIGRVHMPEIKDRRGTRADDPEEVRDLPACKV